MFASLKNRMTRTLVVALVPASLSLVLVSNSFAQANSRIDSIQTDGPGGSGYCLATASDRVADDDDGPGLGGGYITSATPTPIALDGPGSSDPYVLD